jgi:Zn-dependent protease with chaperone function
VPLGGGDACTPAVYRSALYQAGVAALAIVLTLSAAVAAARYTRRVRRSRARTRTHARAALLVGRSLADADPRPAPGSRTVVLDDQRPAAYCVAGRPAAIVVTSGALAVLEPPQLRAVLAHERAHLARRHHALATMVRGLAAAFPGVPLFARAVTEVGRLAEMAADDSAARSAGRVTVASALLTLATGLPVAVPAVPVPADTVLADTVLADTLLADTVPAAAAEVPARVDRLLTPSRPAAAATAAALLGALSALLAVGPALLVLLAR